MKYNNTNGTV